MILRNTEDCPVLIAQELTTPLVARFTSVTLQLEDFLRSCNELNEKEKRRPINARHLGRPAPHYVVIVSPVTVLNHIGQRSMDLGSPGGIINEFTA